MRRFLPCLALITALLAGAPAYATAATPKKTTGKLAATGDRTLAVVGACLIGGIIVIMLGIIWKRRR